MADRKVEHSNSLKLRSLHEINSSIFTAEHVSLPILYFDHLVLEVSAADLLFPKHFMYYKISYQLSI